MKRGIVVLTVGLACASPVHAAPGDPRLIEGVLEWPAQLTVEPFLVIRTNDGGWLYADVEAAKRFGDEMLAAGARLTVIGREASRPFEITANALGPGDVTALARALLPYVNSTTVASGARRTTTPVPSVASPLSGSPAALDPKVAEPSGQLRTSARVWAWPTGTPRWVELQGTVDAVADHWVAVRTDEGQMVLVDLSSVRSMVGSFTPGLPISVYGTPGDSKFQAMGVILSNTQAPAKSLTVPQRR